MVTVKITVGRLLWVIGSNLVKGQIMGENIVWFRLVHLKIYKSRYPMMGICFFFANFASRKSEWWIFQG